jgi:hypothetical protein
MCSGIDAYKRRLRQMIIQSPERVNLKLFRLEAEKMKTQIFKRYKKPLEKSILKIYWDK